MIHDANGADIKIQKLEASTLILKSLSFTSLKFQVLGAVLRWKLFLRGAESTVGATATHFGERRSDSVPYPGVCPDSYCFSFR